MRLSWILFRNHLYDWDWFYHVYYYFVFEGGPHVLKDFFIIMTGTVNWYIWMQVNILVAQTNIFHPFTVVYLLMVIL